MIELWDSCPVKCDKEEGKDEGKAEVLHLASKYRSNREMLFRFSVRCSAHALKSSLGSSLAHGSRISRRKSVFGRSRLNTVLNTRYHCQKSTQEQFH